MLEHLDKAKTREGLQHNRLLSCTFSPFLHKNKNLKIYKIAYICYSHDHLDVFISVRGKPASAFCVFSGQFDELYWPADFSPNSKFHIMVIPYSSQLLTFRSFLWTDLIASLFPFHMYKPKYLPGSFVLNTPALVVMHTLVFPPFNWTNRLSCGLGLMAVITWKIPWNLGCGFLIQIIIRQLECIPWFVLFKLSRYTKKLHKSVLFFFVFLFIQQRWMQHDLSGMGTLHIH